MRVFAHPLRLEQGHLCTVEQGGYRQAQELAVAIVSTLIGERQLAPDFGIFDPVAVGTSRAEVVAAVDLCEPDLAVLDVTIGVDVDRQPVTVTVAWDEDGEEI